MGREPTEQTASDDDLIKVLKALADPTRFRMVQAIAGAGELSCGQATDLFDVSQATISHHLRLLVEAGILVRRVQGKQSFTSVNHALLGQVGALLPTRLAPGATRRAASPVAVSRVR